MSQNTSHAVMAQRAEPHDSLDDFPSPPWCVRALIQYVIWPNLDIHVGARRLKDMTCWEPASNRGYMAKALQDYFRIVRTSDIYDYSMDPATVDVQGSVHDFLIEGAEDRVMTAHGADWVITNPPFRLAAQFVARAWKVKNVKGVAMLTRTAFLEGVERYETLFKLNPPSFVAQFVERVPMVRGRLDGEASTATSYCWLVWMEGVEGTRLVWIPPCRKRLERAGDYPPPDPFAKPSEEDRKRWASFDLEDAIERERQGFMRPQE